jgi:ubiquinone/menaquinone biosynthesis C-methylase UbiE
MNLPFMHPDKIYTHFAGTYDQMVKRMPNWQAWIGSVIPHLQGPRVLDVSFGTGYLLTQTACQFEAYGVDLNAAMVTHARQNLTNHRLHAHLQRADAHHLPYQAESFDTVINTMAFNGYTDSLRALHEMARVLRPGGRLLIVDVNPPTDSNPVGKAFARKWETCGRSEFDMGVLFEQVGFRYEDYDIGGFGSVHLYLAMGYKSKEELILRK